MKFTNRPGLFFDADDGGAGGGGTGSGVAATSTSPPAPSVDPAALKKLEDTVSGLRGSLTQLQSEKKATEQALVTSQAEKTELQEQLTTLAGQVEQISKVLPQLTQMARQGQRAMILSDYPEVMGMTSLKKLFTTVEMPDDQLRVVLEETRNELTQLLLGDDDGEQQTPQPQQPKQVPPGNSPQQQAVQSGQQPTAPNGLENTAPGAPAFPAIQPGGGSPPSPQIPQGPPPVNNSFLGSPPNTKQQAIDEALNAGDVMKMSQLLMDQIPDDLPLFHNEKPVTGG